MIKLYDLAVVTRKYSVNGEDKSSWLNIGSLFQGDNNPFLMLKAHFNPAGIARKNNSESILVSMFTPKDSNYSYDNFCWDNTAGKKLYDLAVGTRKYTKNGEDKTVWENVGVIIMGDKNPYLMLKAHFNPAAIQRKEGNESILISLFKAKEKTSQHDSTDAIDSYENFTPIDYDTGFNSQTPDLDPKDIPF